MNKLNKTFEQGQVLTHSELNDITQKIDEIAELLSSLDKNNGNNSGSSLTALQIQEKINKAKADLQKLVDKQIEELKNSIKKLEDLEEGRTEVNTEEEWAEYRKQIDDLSTRVGSIELTYDKIDLTVYEKMKKSMDDFDTWSSQLSIKPNQISLLVALFDENDKLVIPPASIIAAIVDDNGKLKSEIGISADNVIIDAQNTTLTGKLTGLHAEFADMLAPYATIDRLSSDIANVNNLIGKSISSNEINTNNISALNAKFDDLKVEGDTTVEKLNALTTVVSGKATITDLQNEKASIKQAVIDSLEIPNEASITRAVIDQLVIPTSAEIKQAVIEELDVDDLITRKLTAGDLTVTGVLHYNKIIGDVKNVTQSLTLSDDAYFVQVANQNYNNYITLTLPTNPDPGQTIFIGGTKYYKLKSNKNIVVYYRDIVPEENYKQYLRYKTISPENSQNAFDAGWDGCVQFIYTGQYWQQLIHNISIA